MAENKFRIPLIRPFVPLSAHHLLGAVLDSGYLSEGPMTASLEAAVKRHVGAAHAIATTSATTGLEIALRALGIGPGDEVIVPDFTYPATANVVALLGATAVLVDVSPQTMLIDYAAIERALTPRTRAVMPVPAFGNPCDYDRLLALRAKHGFRIVEDAAPGLGAQFGRWKVGAAADITVFSLHPRKSITTGEGGMVVTDNADWADWMLSFKRFGMEVKDGAVQPRFVRFGSNYKMSDLLAAVGLSQMEIVGEILRQRGAQAARYQSLLQGAPGITLPETTPGGTHAYQSFCVFVEHRDDLLTKIRQSGIEVQIGTYALHREPAFVAGERIRHAGPFPGSEYCYEHALALPLFYTMTEAQQDEVVRELRRHL